MAEIHFLNVLEGDCSIIKHNTGRISVIDISNAYNTKDTPEELKARVIKEKEIKQRNYVPTGKIDYKMKEVPDNPIRYIKARLRTNQIFRFIITHPDMDHIDGIKDFYSEYSIANTWDTDNNKSLDETAFPTKYNPEDWKFYKSIRDGKFQNTKRLTLFPTNKEEYYTEDGLRILSPTPDLVKQANSTGEMHDLSYVLLFKVPKIGGGFWKVIFAGDSHDNTWEYILKNHELEVRNVDILFAPHHGRGSGRDYKFLEVLNPRLTLFGNASSEHLAYDSYKPIRITNNQAGHVIMNIGEGQIDVYVQNKEFADNFRNKRGRNWGEANYSREFDAFHTIGFLPQ